MPQNFSFHHNYAIKYIATMIYQYCLKRAKSKRSIKTSIKEILEEIFRDASVCDTLQQPNGEVPVTVYSMFNLNEYGETTSPELKGKNDCSFASPQAFWARFDELLVRFFEEHPTDVIVQLPSFSYTDDSPSKYQISKEIAAHIEQISPNATIIDDSAIGKLTTLEVFRLADTINSYFKQYWKQQGADLNKAIERLYYYLEIMENKNGGYFSYHYIDDEKMKESIINTMKTLPESYTLYHEVINNKNVLLLDNALRLGQSVNSILSAFNSCYLPKSISLISVFSRPKSVC